MPGCSKYGDLRASPPLTPLPTPSPPPPPSPPAAPTPPPRRIPIIDIYLILSESPSPHVLRLAAASLVTEPVPQQLSPPGAWMGWVPGIRRFLRRRRWLRALRRRLCRHRASSPFRASFAHLPVPVLRTHVNCWRRSSVHANHQESTCVASARGRLWAWLGAASAGVPLRACAVTGDAAERRAEQRSQRSGCRQWMRGCVDARCGAERAVPRVRVAYGEGIGRSRSGPASIRWVVSPVAATHSKSAGACVACC